MSEPVIAAKKPAVVELDPGTYAWCACGHSKTQPYCDGAHQGSGISPLEFTVASRDKVWLCLCKHTQTPPFCDGSHKKL
ncbi:MAG: cytochrome C551 [Nitrospirae bacterium CG18_big_fil_WC_8_21_14_2_50_70_55]|nr:CDGSH iron-sulfur domain-containing protein [Deltaproteobacteria bacterium]OIP62811.1 MAG: cytochrome C551 [Nitrospirae bacterium CG2_30_70_394]PIQ03475.1 MAG: cytochrome C551 [Nitrospirae bacterium CG18_big_fil_WC_8_21_14_2_50_70_55]PIU79938.1 MAG: cytochrome C551 [Nitrospirae bacterium CG06_land_8_20_14_3_00_70_43]PIW82296.1 MAG: cytochrome C551 [Nitrospirae bacterium CG_4_8_14_3_um_filter_70_85]PIX82953.1 MAG: cytochrome C551 [Nitrospirae bacterium CG_4_10_14_3_um_filter_70_108]PJB96008